MPITKTQRWLDLIAFLVKRRFPVRVEDLMEGVPAYALKWRTEVDADRAAVRRMFERDKDELRAAGIPLRTVDFVVDGEAVQGYQLAGKDFYLPYLRIAGEAGAGAAGGGTGGGARAPGRTRGAGAMELEITPDDASLALDALRRVADLPDSPFAAEARSAMNKLGFDLAPPAPAPVLFVDGTGTGGVREVLRVLADALRERRRVRFRYHGIHRGEPTDRDVAPYGLLYQHAQWYLVGDDATRGAIRVFRLGRMADPRVEGKGPGGEYEIPADFAVADYARRQPWELGEDEPLTCDVRFDFPLSLWADRNGHGDAVETRAGGAVVRRFAVRQTEPFLRWLQSFGGDAVVVAPAEMRRAQAAMARETLALYGA